MANKQATGHPSPAILVVAGEASGDGYAARLVAALQELVPEARFFGVGGEALAAQGVRLLFSAHELAVTGLTEVIGRLPAVLKALKTIAAALRDQRPALAILVDFPDFNFLVARLAKWRGVPVMYYISPQVWAWRTYRVRTMARLVRRLVVIFPFEEDFYRRRGLTVDYVGNPLPEILPRTPAREVLLPRWGLDPEQLTVALLPGSRGSEIERHLPAMLAGAELFQRTVPRCQFILPVASTVSTASIQELVDEFNHLKLRLIKGQAYEALTAAHLAVVASGTATLEAALAGTPTIIVYRLAPLSFAVGKLLIRVDHVGMANLLAGERLFPELLQDDFTPAAVAREMLALLREPERWQRLRQGLKRVQNSLGAPGASRRAAQVALELLPSNHH